MTIEWKAEEPEQYFETHGDYQISEPARGIEKNLSLSACKYFLSDPETFTPFQFKSFAMYMLRLLGAKRLCQTPWILSNPMLDTKKSTSITVIKDLTKSPNGVYYIKSQPELSWSSDQSLNDFPLSLPFITELASFNETSLPLVKRSVCLSPLGQSLNFPSYITDSADIRVNIQMHYDLQDIQRSEYISPKRLQYICNRILNLYTS